MEAVLKIILDAIFGAFFRWLPQLLEAVPAIAAAWERGRRQVMVDTPPVPQGLKDQLDREIKNAEKQ